MIRSAAIAIAVVLVAGCARPAGDPSPTRRPDARTPAAIGPDRVIAGSLPADGPVRRIRGERHPVAVHRVDLAAGRPVEVSVAAGDGLVPWIEARPVDGDPEETVRFDEIVTGTGAARITILPRRDGPWDIEVCDALARTADYTLRIAPLRERAVLRLDLGVAPALDGSEAPATAVFPVAAGRTYRIRITADGFAPHAVAALPGVAPRRMVDGAMTAQAARGGLAILQVRSLSAAAGPCRVVVDECWP